METSSSHLVLASTYPVFVARPYGQYCGLAKALDVVGGRWTLLVIRELLVGPQRYTDLLAGIPGVSTDVLASRLRELEAAGVVEKRVLAPPASSNVYELTELGMALARPVGALAAWGANLLGSPRRGDAYRLSWLLLPLRARFRPELAEDLDCACELRVGKEMIGIRIVDGRLDTAESLDRDPDVIITTDAQTLLRLGRGTAAIDEVVDAGSLGFDGDLEVLATLVRAFGM